MPPIPASPAPTPAGQPGTRVNGANPGTRAARPPAVATVEATPPGMYTTANLTTWGIMRADAFCKANRLPPMRVVLVPRAEWHVGACAYWRNSTCYICPELCSRPAAGEADRRNWNWPGAVTDRTPYGVICHELGHHADWHSSDPASRGPYWGMVCQQMLEASGEKAITSYAPNPAEWFAEMFRLFASNHALLYHVRRKTWDLMTARWEPVSDDDWRVALGPGVPDRIVATQLKR